MARLSCRHWFTSSLLALLGILGLPLGALRAQEAGSMKEIYTINHDWEQAMLRDASARRIAKSQIELELAQKDYTTIECRLVERCVDLARSQPDRIAGLIALKMVACRSPKTEEGKKAAEALVKHA